MVKPPYFFASTDSLCESKMWSHSKSGRGVEVQGVKGSNPLCFAQEEKQKGVMWLGKTEQ